MWEYYYYLSKETIDAFYLLAVVCFMISIFIFICFYSDREKINDKEKMDIIIIIKVIVFMFILFFCLATILPRKQFAKNKACEIEKVEYLCEEKE